MLNLLKEVKILLAKSTLESDLSKTIGLFKLFDNPNSKVRKAMVILLAELKALFSDEFYARQISQKLSDT